MQISKYILIALKYFAIQTICEVILIVVLMYCGFSYSEMSVGAEPLWEIIIGILGYHAFFKLLIFGWLYLLLFVVIGKAMKFKNQLGFGIVNLFLSLLLPVMIVFIRHLTFTEMEIVFIATLISSVIVLLVGMRFDNLNKLEFS